MKRIFLFIFISMFGFAKLNASYSGATSVLEKPVKTSFKYNEKGRAPDLSIHESATKVFKCTVTVRFKSETVNVTMNFEAATCNEAWAAAKRITDQFIK